MCSRRFPGADTLGVMRRFVGPTLELRGRSRARVRFLSGRVGYRWPMEVGMDHVEVGGLRVTYRQAGQGPPLVLLHGGLGDSREWRQQLEGLADDFTVTAWDAPGCGGSSAPGWWSCPGSGTRAAWRRRTASMPRSAAFSGQS